MAVFKIPSSSSSTTDKIILWSPLPYSTQVIDKIVEFTGVPESNLSIDYVIIPDREHNLAGKKYQEIFKDCKLIGMEGINNMDIDYKFTSKIGNKVIRGDELKEIINDEVIYKNFEFVYLPHHANQELVVFNPASKAMFEADLLFNLGVPGSVEGKVVLEQYSPELGFPKGFNPHSGWSFVTRYLQPWSKVGGVMFRKLVDVNKSKSGLEAIYGWDFNTIVMCHGNIITENAKEDFKHVFL
ncbi:hypothetical protein SBY92_000892 [Candida maltosa Xu316]